MTVHKYYPYTSAPLFPKSIAFIDQAIEREEWNTVNHHKRLKNPTHELSSDMSFTPSSRPDGHTHLC